VAIHQFVAAATRGDAITNEALRLRDLLRAHGESEIYAAHVHPELRGNVLPVAGPEATEPPNRSSDLLLVHGSIGGDAVNGFLTKRRERMVLRYHNITPSEHFAPYDPEFAELLDRGRVELTALRNRVELAIAVSEYNRLELEQMGFSETEVIPILSDVAGLLDEPPVSLAPLGVNPDARTVLFVGRVAPNKGHFRLLAAFHVLKTYLEPAAQLVMAGGGEVAAYAGGLRRYRRELALPDVVFTGPVSPPQLAALYRTAAVFVCLSAHEGFCVPLIEAMEFGVPVVAWDTSAVGETAGGAALLLDDPAPTLVAEAVHRVVNDAELRGRLVSAGRARAAELSPALVGPLLRDRLLRAAG
jgi:glycosyltransferase involved in cell wall biosynthesis